MLPVQFDERVREVLFEHAAMKTLAVRFEEVLLSYINIVMQGGIFGQLGLIEDGREETDVVDPIGSVIGDIGGDACPVTESGDGTGNRMIETVDAVDEDTDGALDEVLMTHEGIADDGLPEFLMARSLFDHPAVTIGHDEDHGLA